MMPNRSAPLLGVLLAAVLSTRGDTAPQGSALLAVEVESIENTLDGCGSCGCRARGELEADRRREWWISFGVVKRQAEKNWEAVGSSSYCGRGSFEKAAAEFRRTIGIPYVVLDLSTTASVPPEGEVNLRTGLKILKLSGFDRSHQPVYAPSTESRVLRLKTEGDATLPVLIPDQRERDAFGVHEVLLRLRANVLRRGPAASYGNVSVTADVPGSEILLDGGLVGRTPEENPLLLKNVSVGEREVRVRDFSGREAHKRVVVEKDWTTDVGLNLLDLSSAKPQDGLVLIGQNPQGQKEYWRVKDGATAVRIPAGEFLRGSPEGQGEPAERPQHRIYVSEFLIDKTEVTWRQFRKFTQASGTPLPSAPVWGTPDDYAASFILWEEARQYCDWVGGRLPTEAEWEKAARGADGATYPWGNDWDPDRCNSIDGGPHRPESVGSFPGCLSPYGVLDMAGGVWEWCADWYGEDYYAASPPRDPPGPTSGTQRVLRGGTWMSPYVWLRPAFRYKSDPTWRYAHYGFRCAQNVPE